MSDIRDVVDGQVVSPKVEVAEPMPSVPANDVGNQQLIDEIAISQVLGIENKDMGRYSDEFDTIMRWAKLEGYDNPAELKWMIRSLQNRLGTPPLTEKWISRVSRYAYLQLQQEKIKAEQEGLLR